MMSTVEDRRYYREGRVRLRSWLRECKAVAADEEPAVVRLSAIAAAMMPYVTEANMDAVLIYPARHGGWHAHMRLKACPAGISNIFGTPLGMPLPTEQDAKAMGRRLLIEALRMAERNRTDPTMEKPLPAFVIDGVAVSLVQHLLDTVAELKPDGYTRERCVERIGEVLVKHYGGRFSQARFDAGSSRAQAALLSALHIAAVHGVLRYPPMMEGTPSGDLEPSEVRH